MTPKKLFAIVFPLLIIEGSFAQTLNKSYVTTDGRITTTAAHGDTLYIGGGFSSVGYSHRQFAKFSNGKTEPDRVFPEFSGSINMIELDGNGGYYLVGLFDNYNGRPVNSSILHLLPDYSLDTNFQVNVNTKGSISMAKRRDKKLYVCGSFTKIQNINVRYLAVLDAETGQYIEWTHDVPSSEVDQIELKDSLLVLRNGVAELGGYFTPGNIAALNLNTGKIERKFPCVNRTVNSFQLDHDTMFFAGNFGSIGSNANSLAYFENEGENPDLNFPTTDGWINSITQDNSGGFFVGGVFSEIGNQKRANLAHLLADGTVDSSFDMKVDGEIFCLASKESKLYVGGGFSHVNNLHRISIAEIDLSANTVTEWNPGTNGMVRSISLFDSIIYVSGYFTQIAHTNRAYAAALTEDSILPWNPKPDNIVNQILPAPNGRSVFLAGNFNRLNGNDIPNLAKVDAITGQPDNWKPAPNGGINSIYLKNNLLFVGGGYSSIGNQPHQNLAIIDTSSNAPLNINLNTDGYVQKITIDGEKLFVAGQFNSVKDSIRHYIAAISLSDYSLDSFNPSPDWYVSDVSVVANNVAFGGSFKIVSAVPRNYLAAVNMNDLEVTSWNPQIEWSFNPDVEKILHINDETFIAGTFDCYYNASLYKNIFSIDNKTGLVSRTFEYYPTGSINKLMIDKNNLLVAGNFTNLSSNSGRILNVQYLATYSLKKHNKVLQGLYVPNHSVEDMIVNSNKDILLAGYFSLVNATPRNGLAAIDLKSGNVTTWDPQLSQVSAINSIALHDTILYVGGAFSAVGKDKRKNLAAISIYSGRATNWIWNTNSSVSALELKDTVLYVSGSFSRIGNVKRNFAAAITVSNTGMVTPWNPSPDYPFKKIVLDHDSLIVGGEFRSIKNIPRLYLAKVDAIKGNLSSADFAPNDPVNDIALDSERIYVVGSFSAVAGKSRDGFAVFDRTTNQLLKLNPKFTFQLNTPPNLTAVKPWNDQIFLGSFNITSVNDVPCGLFIGIDTTVGNLTLFDPRPNEPVSYCGIYSDKLVTGGYWSSIGNNISPAYFAVFDLPSVGQFRKSGINYSASSYFKFPTNKHDLHVVFYPNPVTNILHIAGLSSKQKTTLTIVDVNGNIRAATIATGESYDWNIAQLAQGGYILKIESGTTVVTKKFIKE